VQEPVSQQEPLETGRVPQVRQSVPGPKMVFSNAFTPGGTPNLEPEIKALAGAKPPSFSSQVRWCEPGAPVQFLERGGGVQVYIGYRFLTLITFLTLVRAPPGELAPRSPIRYDQVCAVRIGLIANE
jgi:hypothetical protein